jgi:hypothetical protein
MNAAARHIGGKLVAGVRLGGAMGAGGDRERTRAG